MLLPGTIDNTFAGHRAALWLFGLIVAARLTMGLNVILNGHSVATRADGVPLGDYPPPAVQTILALFALWGLGQLLFALVGILVLVRYRGFVPFLLLLALAEQVLRKVVLQFIPVVRRGDPPASIINLILLVITLVGLALSLRRQKEDAGEAMARLK